MKTEIGWSPSDLFTPIDLDQLPDTDRCFI